MRAIGSKSIPSGREPLPTTATGSPAPYPTGSGRPTYLSARAVGSFVPKLTRKAFEKYGFSTASLLTDWASIVGPQLARGTFPERLKWPRMVETYGEVEAGAEGRPGATLFLRVDASRALDVEYRRAEIVDRINSYFGYRAVASLRVVQVPAGSDLARQPGSRQTPTYPPAKPATKAQSAGEQTALPEIEHIANDGLRAALARMQAAVRGSR